MILPRMIPQAVHIEYLDDLTTNAFIRALRCLTELPTLKACRRKRRTCKCYAEVGNDGI